MKYTNTVDIALPRDEVVALFDDLDNYSAWQESLVSLEPLEGEPGQVGTRTRLNHKMGKREVTMVETVTARELPDAFTATYEAPGVWNQAINRFSEIEGGHTRWDLDSEFRCSGFMWVLTTFAPGMFKKQTQATMEAFKAFAESQDAPAGGAEDPPVELQSSDAEDAAPEDETSDA